MREIIAELNKSTLAEATGISYSRLRKFSAGVVKELTPEEKKAIYPIFELVSLINLKINKRGCILMRDVIGFEGFICDYQLW